MNPDQPSREQIEARLTALLLGELPAAEAELLRFTISQDPELQKLHDQLKLTVGFVREAMKNPTGAPVDRETPLKLAHERRQKLLAHFKSARQQPPQPPEELFWLRRIKIPSRRSIAATALVTLVICGLIAISIPNFVKSRSTSQVNACINNLRQIDAAKNEWALENHKSADAVPTVNDLSPYLQGGTIRSVAGENYVLGKVSEPTVAEINGKRMTAAPEEYFSLNTELSATHSEREPKAVLEYRLEAAKASRTPNSLGMNSQEPKVPPQPVSVQPAPIALPKTESSQAESEQNADVYSQSVVGYVNIAHGASSWTSSTISSDSTQAEQKTGYPELGPNPAPNSGFAGGILAAVPPPPASAELPQLAGRGIPSTPAGGGSIVSFGEAPKLEPPPKGPTGSAFNNETNAAAVNNSFDNGIRSFGGSGGGGGSVPVSIHANPNDNLALPTLANSQSSGGAVGSGGGGVPINHFMARNGFIATNAIAMNQAQFNFYGNSDRDQSSEPLITRETPNANSVDENEMKNGLVENPNAQVPVINPETGLPASAPAATTPVTAPPPADAPELSSAATFGLVSQPQKPNPSTAPAMGKEQERLRTIHETPESIEPSTVPANSPNGEFEQLRQMQIVPKGPIPVPSAGVENGIVESQNAQSVSTSKSWFTSRMQAAAALPAASAPTEQIEPPPLITRESQNASSIAENTDQMQIGSLSDAETASDLEKLKKERQEEEAQIQIDQSKVDQLRRHYGIHDLGVSSTPAPTISAEQVQELNEKLIEQKAAVLKNQNALAEIQSIEATNPAELNSLADIKAGFQAQVDAGQAQMGALNQQLNDFEKQDQANLEKDQPYWRAKANLENEEDLHKLLSEKIQVDESEAAMPKGTLVTIVNPAQAATSQNLWQRLTGTVESQARIEINPDVSTTGSVAYAPYDPYFLQTELDSIQGDAVLGKVVDALNLEQAWSKPGDTEILSRKDAITLLRSHLDVQMIQNTKLINIGAKSDKPDEAANIANAVAEAYKQYRLEVHSNEMAAGIDVLQRKYAADDKRIRELQTQVAQMEPPASTGQNHPSTPPPANAPIPQPEIQTTDNAFSTFSMNVSDVSFKLAMASLQKGQMPDPASIRSEEFINAFDYHDPEPLQGEPLAFMSERAGDPFAHERDLLRFSIKAAAAGRQGGRALNIVLLIDTSGSMERADRVAIIQEALRVLASQLQPQDVVSVVSFARTARLWADGIPGDEAGATLDKVGSITPEGGTNLEEAMRLAYETALRHFIAGGMNRVVLLTDGAANLGNVDPKALTQKVDSEGRQGIALDCFGIGWDDYNDDLLEQLSSNGDGRYAFINSPDEAATEFAAKLAGALQVAAEDVKVQVEFNPNRVTAWRQVGYAKHQLTKEQFRDNSVAAGAIAAREAGNALYVIETNPDGQGPIATVRVRYRVPGTQDVYERSWLVDYTGPAADLAQSGPPMRLAVTAAEISEWMADSPFAQDVTPDDLLNYLSDVPQYYGTDERPKQLEWMIREAKSVSGK